MIAAIVLAVAIGGALQPTSVADPALTPGKIRPELTLEQIQNTRWGADRRLVTAHMKAQVYQRYGFSGPFDPRCTPDANGHRCEVDHRVPRCAAGADDIENLSPQPYGGPWNAHMKDRVEDRVCRMLDAGVISLADGQAIFLGDWTVTYREWFGDPPAN